MAILYATTGLCESSAPWTTSGFSGVTVTTVSEQDLYGAASPATSTATSTPTFTMEPTFLFFRGTSWSHDQVMAHLLEIARIYNTDACRILIKKVTLVETDPYKGLTDVDWATVYVHSGEPTGHDLEIAKAIPQTAARPVVVLMQSSYQMYTAYAGVKAAVENDFRAPLLNTAWVMAQVNDPLYISRIPKGYDPIAHELAHLFGNMPFHNNLDEPNILHDDFNKVNDKILPEQCEEFKKSEMVHREPRP